MKKIYKILLSVFSALTLLCLSVSPISAMIDSNNKLSFNSNGKFKIVVFADCQDGSMPNSKMISFMEVALDYEKPDLVVFTGDNVLTFTNSAFKTGATKIIQPLIDRNIPYAYTYGNHDDQYGVSKEYQYEVYKTLGNCLTYDDAPEITGVGNCNLPIYSSDKSNIAFNLWMIDSNSYDGGTTKYDHVHQDQLDWYKQKSAEIDKQAGKKIYSIMFQHIIMPEAYQLLCEDSSGSKTYAGKTYRQELNSKASGYLGEFPCPPAENGGEFDVLSQEGNVLGVVTGHDHSNDFVGTVGNIDFLQTGGMSFRSYGDVNARGYRVINLDESKPDDYTTNTVKYTDYENGALSGDSSVDVGKTEYSYPAGTAFLKDISFSGNSNSTTAKNTLIDSGYTLIDYDLNKGAGGNYIYMGYKTTNSYADAIKSIRFYIDSSNSDSIQFYSVSNGNHVTYTRASSQDLNAKAGGKYIYGFYTKDCLAGPALTTDMVFSQTAYLEGYNVCTSFSEVSTAADLNKGTNDTEIYLLYKTDLCTAVDSDMLRQEYSHCQKLIESYDVQDKLETEYTQAGSVITELDNSGATAMTQDEMNALAEQLKYLRNNIKFDVNLYSDNQLISSDKKSLEKDYVITDTIPEKEHNLFMGWSSQEGSDEVSYKAGDIISEEKDTNLYAVWKHYSEIFYPATGSDTKIDYEDCYVYGLSVQLDELVGKVDSLEGYTYTVNNVRDCIATDTKVKLYDAKGNNLETYTVVIFGDVNSDGVYDGSDAVIVTMLSSGMLTKENVGDAVYMAADCNHDGVINSSDVLILEQAGIFLNQVDQSLAEKELTSSSAYNSYINLISQDNVSISTDDVVESEETDDTDTPEDVVPNIFSVIKSAIIKIIEYIKLELSIFVG